MNKFPVCRPAAIPFFICAVAFIAIGVSQKAFLGVGFAMLGLAIAFSGKSRRDGQP
ncbi:MAG: hypothetical protein QM769_06315 [Pseudoxanthomonas sp.]